MNAALLIIDIQNDYFEGGTNTLYRSESASLNARQILDKFRSENLPIVQYQVMHALQRILKLAGKK
jgi:nicotinamidase-related amidase